MKNPTDVAELLVSLECELLHPPVRRSARVAELLGESFVEFGSSGRRFDRQAIIENLKSESPVNVKASEFQVEVLAPGVALVTYQSSSLAARPSVSLRSSIWQFQGEAWRMVFHQGTPVPPA